MIRSIFLSLALSTLSILPLQAENGNNYREIPKLSLSAEASIKKPADELRMNIGVVTIGNTAEEALAENNIRMESVIKGLKDAGLSKGDYETGQFSITPTYTPYPKNPPPEWRQSINGYEVRNTLLIHTPSIDAAGRLIDAANQAGANTIDNIHFALSDPRLYSDEAISRAIANGVHDAEMIAQAANVKLVQILSINADQSYSSPQPHQIYFAKAMVADNAPPIEAGDVVITARISLVYEIKGN